MNFKKRVNGSWTNTLHYIHKTDTDTITTLPAVVYPNAATATVGLKGQATQSGTPTPDNPIMPEGTGERTGNLIDYPYFTNDGLLTGVTWITTMHSIKASGTTTSGTNFYFFRNKLLKAGTYRITINGMHKGLSLFLRDTTSSTMIANLNQSTNTYTFTLESDMLTCSLYFNQGSANVSVDIDCTIMLNTGSTSLPYEPYGYKIPISSADTTTPVYLGEVETTRRVKKYEFTGQETGWNYSTSGGRARAYIRLSDSLGASLCICSHYDYVNSPIYYPDIDKFTLNSTGSIVIGLDSTIYTDVTAFKAYLAQQYANGTPVTVWYVLATEETAAVNEPLMRIGDYADTLSGISIPVTAGGDTLSVGTTVQPSEVTVNYKGWHPVADVHERENGQWD